MTKRYFCWVRVLDVKTDARRAPVEHFHGDLRELGPRPAILYGSRPPGIVGSNTRGNFLAVWAGVPEVFGREGASTMFDYGPAFDDEEEALNWLTCPDGQIWDQDALNRFLMSFNAVVPPTNTAPNNTFCTGAFPETDWADEFRFKHLRSPVMPLFHHADLSLKRVSDYAGDRDECQALMDLIGQREAAELDIRAEASSPAAAVFPVLKAAGLPIGQRPASKKSLALNRLRDTVIDAIEPSIYLFKRRDCRARPWTDCANLNAMFANRALKNYPGHPSFPSGHATLAYVFAYLIGYKHPGQLQALEAEAACVAKRREIAGVHFESDSDAGKHLARQMVDLMLDKNKNPSFDAFGLLLKALD